jgi:hypothetical protein
MQAFRQNKCPVYAPSGFIEDSEPSKSPKLGGLRGPAEIEQMPGLTLSCSNARKAAPNSFSAIRRYEI